MLINVILTATKLIFMGKNLITFQIISIFTNTMMNKLLLKITKYIAR